MSAFGPRADDVMEVVSQASGVPVEDIRGVSRFRRVLRARALVVWVLREYGEWSYPEIGHYFDKDHTTFVHMHRRIGALTTPEQREEIKMGLGL